jgi:hypothetical protein
MKNNMNNNRQQTSVEQFAEQLASKNLLGIYTYDEMVMFEDLLKHSKEMEEQQNANTWNNAINAVEKDKWESFEQYYEQTYGSNK